MNGRPKMPIGLDVILESLAMRYEYDHADRIIRALGDGILPRFVLGRSREGCIWRFAADLGPDRIKAVARLAGREPGRPTAGQVLPAPPERLVVIERLLRPEEPELRAGYEILTHKGVALAELWTMP